MITAKLESLSRRAVDIPGDGNCLFHLVADQLMNHPLDPQKHLNHITLRQMVVEYLRNHCEELEVLFF